MHLVLGPNDKQVPDNIELHIATSEVTFEVSPTMTMCSLLPFGIQFSLLGPQLKCTPPPSPFKSKGFVLNPASKIRVSGVMCVT